MRILSNLDGTTTCLVEVGDLVRLRRDEEGPLVTAFAGDWGRVTRVHPHGALDVRLAGYSRPPYHPLGRALEVPRSFVEPCDRQGRRLPALNPAAWAEGRGRG